MNRLTVDCTTVDLGGNRSLRLSLYRESDGTPVDLLVEEGFGSGAGWRTDGARLSLPPACIGAIREALEGLTT